LVSRRRVRPALPAIAVTVAALAPAVLLAIAFPAGGSEPFGFLTLFPILLLAVVALVTLPADAVTLRAGVVIYALATILVYLVSSPIGSNITRMGALLAAPVAALVWWRRRTPLFLVAALPLLAMRELRVPPLQGRNFKIEANLDGKDFNAWNWEKGTLFRARLAVSGRHYRGQPPGDRDGVEAGVLGPALDGDLSLADIDAYRNLFGPAAGGRLDQIGIAHGGGPQDHPADAADLLRHRDRGRPEWPAGSRRPAQRRRQSGSRRGRPHPGRQPAIRRRADRTLRRCSVLPHRHSRAGR